MFNCGATVRVTANWLLVPKGTEGQFLHIAFENPVTCLVEFSSGTYPIPAVHLELVADGQPLRAAV